MHLDTTRYVYDLDEPPRVGTDELHRLIGGKAANLVVMATELALPVPPGFAITTDACREYLAGRWPVGLDAEVRAHVERLGEGIGRRFADRAEPLFVSVRSGAPVSMPGMMDTILNLGLNEATADGLGRAVGDPAFAADCLQRFRAGYVAVVGADEVPDDPWVQLRAAIESVFRSWNSDRATAYRRREGIPDDLGTAVTVQAMVFGNRGEDSGTGVLFTRNPSTGEPMPYGDVMFDAQGEEVVAGAHATEPLAALDERLPEVAAELRRHADRLERHFRDLCDVEFTIEQGRLWLLQVRVGKRSPRAALRMAIDMAEEEAFPLSREEAVQRVLAYLADPPRHFRRAGNGPRPVAAGLPASPGIATGAIVTSSDAAEAAVASGQVVILVRPETSPEDVRGMACAAGVLTARGGLASHAAVVARGWGIAAVVGASDVHPGDETVEIDGRVLEVGDAITIDGSTGEVFLGELEGRWEIAPEAGTLLAWAADLGIDVDADAAVAEARRGDGSAGLRVSTSGKTRLTRDHALRSLLIKGAATSVQLIEALLAKPTELSSIAEPLKAEGLVEASDGSYRLSAEGKLSALGLFEADRAAVGHERCVELLLQFHSLDSRMKEIVTAWQVRKVGGEQTLNDHADVAYDEGVLGELAALHSETAEWLAPLADRLARYRLYGSRLARALEHARTGDERFVASPRVDSYHGVWFELHEDLIRLAGRRRADEALAGRA